MTDRNKLNEEFEMLIGVFVVIAACFAICVLVAALIAMSIKDLSQLL